MGDGAMGPMGARRALHHLHCAWVLAAGASIEASTDCHDACLEVSPLLSYEGEGLTQVLSGERVETLPHHFTAPGEVDRIALAKEDIVVDDDDEFDAAVPDENKAPQDA